MAGNPRNPPCRISDTVSVLTAGDHLPLRGTLSEGTVWDMMGCSTTLGMEAVHLKYLQRFAKSVNPHEISR